MRNLSSYVERARDGERCAGGLEGACARTPAGDLVNGRRALGAHWRSARAWPWRTGRRRGTTGCPFVAPTEVECEILKSSFFVVAVFLWSNRVIIRINMHREATRNPQMVPWGWGEGRKKYFFISLIFYEKNISI